MNSLKNAFSKVKSGEPVAKIRSNAPAEDCWPTDVDAESKRAAAALRSWFVDGFVVPYRTLNSIGNEVLKHAHGLIVFTVLREGLRPKEADGSGIVVLRLPSGTWSPPAAVAVHTSGSGVWDGPEAGDVFDCLCVINDASAAEGLKNARCTFGDLVPAPTAGSIGGSLNDSHIAKPKTAIWMWLKGKGHYIEDAQLKGVTLEYRKTANEHFYGLDELLIKQILNGEVQAPSGPASQLLEVLKAVESGNHNSNELPSYSKSPGDYALEPPSK